MRFFFMILTAFMLLSSCVENNQKTTIINHDNIERIDTIFLGYSFNMSELEVQQKTNDLIIDEKLEKDETYKIVLDQLGNTTTSNISFEYHNEKLYRLTLKVNTNHLYSSTELLQSKLLLLYMRKYGVFEDDQNENYYLVLKNLMIDILRNNIDNYIIISYTDLPINQAIQDKDKEKGSNTYNNKKDEI